MPSFFTRTDEPIRPVPAGCGQQRWPERRVQHDTCAEEGGTPADPVPSGTTPRKRWTGPVSLLVMALSAVVACYLIATTLAAIGVPLAF